MDEERRQLRAIEDDTVRELRDLDVWRLDERVRRRPDPAHYVPPGRGWYAKIEAEYKARRGDILAREAIRLRKG